MSCAPIVIKFGPGPTHHELRCGHESDRSRVHTGINAWTGHRYEVNVCPFCHQSPAVAAWIQWHVCEPEQREGERPQAGPGGPVIPPTTGKAKKRLTDND